jgi:hypothetical protein
MDQILADIKKLIEEGDEDQVLEFIEILMWQNKKLIAQNKQFSIPQPEPEQELRGLEKIEFREGISEEEFFAARSSD